MTAAKTKDLRALTLRAVADGDVRRAPRADGRGGVQALYLLADVKVDAVVHELWNEGLVTEPGAGPPTLTIDGWRKLRTLVPPAGDLG